MPSALQQLCHALDHNLPLDDALIAFVTETKSRAAGLWRLNEGHLEMIGFSSVSDMPREVDQGFREITRRVSLEQNQFGIVRAVNTNSPTLARRDPGDTGLTGSASWNAKFASETSLAIPVYSPQSSAIIGAIAVSTTEILHEQHPVWTAIVNLAKEVGCHMPC
jgi:hypothetical protein